MPAGFDLEDGPISLVAADIHLDGRQTSAGAGDLETFKSHASD
jgi:hypothetical protein